MAGSGSKGRRTVLIHEFVTGGGMIGRDLPPSWAAEGGAMRRAIAADFASLPGVRVLTTLDARLPPDPPAPGVETRIITDRPFEAFQALASRSDHVLAIAPETGGLLADHARALRRLGVHSLGSEPEAIDLVADKARLAAHFERCAIPSPPTRTFVPASGLSVDWPGPLVVKPVDGAGSLDTFVIRDPRRLPPGLLEIPVAIVQPCCPGEPRSASYLIGRDGRATLLGVGRQRIEVDAGGRIAYLGGTIPVEPDGDLAVVEAALASVPGLRGFVGVDFLHRREPIGPAGPAQPGRLILEINPRPTTSFVGLSRWLGPGSIAAAWLAALEGSPLSPFTPTCPSVSFDADGSIRLGAAPG